MQAIETLVSPDLNLPENIPADGASATGSAADSSRLLLELIALSEQARSSSASDAAALEGIVAPVILRKLLAALHFRDSATVQHSRRVSQLALGIARHLRWEGTNLRRVEVRGLLPDRGQNRALPHVGLLTVQPYHPSGGLH